MEIIEPFIYHSKLYRSLKQSPIKNKLFLQWNDESVKQKQKFMRQRSSVVCEYCFNENTAVDLCKHCLFPLCVLNIDKELALYCLLSVCFWEDGKADNYQIWRSRIQMAWESQKNTYKVYTIIVHQCMQCGAKVNETNVTLKKFDFKLFCINCLFPLFQISISSSSFSSSVSGLQSKTI
ncbi:hypothetical protein AhnVgp046 [Adoxophyes honmai nucleopolyhedrovirus]|uniref:Ac52 n=1 Tax=Adoxophyes honmai nucleopolyhedrovirus TaxID=224399 RepID=Q80LQ0_NPVAH|nr:hypothetical protein AhnVgp046 [Adoxophyes honmai nucleopolyhedrovirus]BAC67297.1 hypothetical protein [Adoxophyes honmai nucleopolyhedrovirus]